MNEITTNVTVKLFATFQKNRFAVQAMTFPAGTTVEQICSDLRIPKAEVGVLMINGRHVEFDRCPDQGDVLAIFPVIGGG